MKVLYDNIHGSGMSAPAVTDVYSEMLQVSRSKPDAPLLWRKVMGDRFGLDKPRWLGGDRDAWSYYHYRNALTGQSFPLGAPLTPKEAKLVIKHFAFTLRRGRGTLIVQLREHSPGLYYIALYHTTDTLYETVNPVCPEGFPKRV